MSEGGGRWLGEPSNHSTDKFPRLLWSSLQCMGRSSDWNFLTEAIPLTKVEISFLQFRVQDTKEGKEGRLGGTHLNPNGCPASTSTITTTKPISTTTDLFPTLCLVWLMLNVSPATVPETLCRWKARRDTKICAEEMPSLTAEQSLKLQEADWHLRKTVIFAYVRSSWMKKIPQLSPLLDQTSSL